MSNTHVFPVELSKKKIRAMRNELDSKNSVFLDKRFLESLGPPVNIIGREIEAKQILELVYGKNDDYIVQFVSIYGASGTGKTTVVRFVCDNISDVSSSCFVNFREAKSIFSCANLILEELDSEPVKSWEGINHAMEKIEDRIEETLVRDEKRFFVLVLDEFDTIFFDSRGRPSDFIYKLMNVVESLRTKDYLLCVVTISNASLSDFSIDERAKSRIENSEVFFAPYSKDEILYILRNRASKAFVEKISEDVLEKCAQLSRNENGDCRNALQLLRNAGEIADGKKVTVAHVEKASVALDKDIMDLVLKTATPHQKLLLAALAALVLWTKKEEHSTKDIFERYEFLCGPTKLKHLSYRRAFALLADLENTGIITARNHSSGRHGYHNFYRLVIHYDIVGCRISPDWWFKQRDEYASAQKLDALAKKWLDPSNPFGGSKYKSLAMGKN